MRDQAEQLRSLVLRSARDNMNPPAPPPQLVVLTGGKGGVGTTTLSVNLAVAMAQQGRRVILVDADLQRADVASLCGLNERFTIADVLSARVNIHEVLDRGPGGIQILPGAWASGALVHCTVTAQQRLIQQLKSLGRHADIILLDAGSGACEVVRRFWREADDVGLISTPDPVAVMDSYAVIKMLLAGEPPPVRVVVNQTEDETSAEEVYRRIDLSCHRFLGIRTVAAGHVPHDRHVPAAAQNLVPLMIQSPKSQAARAMERIAASLSTFDGARRAVTRSGADQPSARAAA